MAKVSAINWFEIPVSDFDRAKRFYETIFEFEMKEQTWANTRIGYFEWDREEDGRGGSIVYDPEFYQPSVNGSLIYLNCEPSIQKVIDRVVPAGGKILQNKTIVAATFDLGYWALMLDTEGNRVALHGLE
jgi:predicted enzyme related to lactoylglutathione lyase